MKLTFRLHRTQTGESDEKARKGPRGLAASLGAAGIPEGGRLELSGPRPERVFPVVQPHGLPEREKGQGAILYPCLDARGAEPSGHLGREREQRLQAHLHQCAWNPDLGAAAPCGPAHGQAVDHPLHEERVQRPLGRILLRHDGSHADHHDPISQCRLGGRQGIGHAHQHSSLCDHRTGTAELSQRRVRGAPLRTFHHPGAGFQGLQGRRPCLAR